MNISPIMNPRMGLEKDSFAPEWELSVQPMLFNGMLPEMMKASGRRMPMSPSNLR
ncbi:MAG: hypothetical protein AAF329_02285 [Cyanobacteria bacterium P01_A01_bin.17]